MEGLKKFMETGNIVVGTEGRLLIIPWSSDQHIELAPVPTALPFGAIKGEEFVA
jgi:hypothetical protein